MLELSPPTDSLQSPAAKPSLPATDSLDPPTTKPQLGIVYSSMGAFDIRSHYIHLLEQDPTKSMPIAAIESLSALCDSLQANTIHELMSTLNDGAEVLKTSFPNSVSLTAGCDMFKRFIVSHAHDDPRDIEAFKHRLRLNGHFVAHRAREARGQIAEFGVGLIADGITVMVHGYSRCVIAMLIATAKRNIRFKVIATATMPSGRGLETAKELRAAGIPVAVIEDSAVAYAMRKCRLVVLGAEAVFTNGGILNVLGSQQVAAVANQYKRKVYVCTETHKFVDIFPINQYDVPVKQTVIEFDPPADLQGLPTHDNHNFVDYAQPKLITNFITNEGILTPAMVADVIVMNRFA